jgi:hypothetical protein
MAESWHRRRDLGERKSQYDAFTHYRDMPPGARSVDGAFRLHRAACRKLPERAGIEAPGPWRQWAKQFAWDDRAHAHDSSLEDARRVQTLESIRKAAEQDAAIGAAGMSKVAEWLMQATGASLTPGQATLLMREASALRRRALGEPTDYVRQEHTGAVDVNWTEFFNEMTDDERAVIRRVLERRAGRSGSGA